MSSHPRLARQPFPLLLAIAVTTAAVAHADPPSLRATFDRGGVLVTEGDQPVLYYQRAVKSFEGDSSKDKWSRANYVHPLYDLNGQVITEDFPEDHRHHRGVFWAWHQVWVGQRKLGDPWLCRDFVWDVTSVAIETSRLPLILSASVDWKSPEVVDRSGAMSPLVREDVSIVVHPKQKNHRVIDFNIKLIALVDEVRIGGSEDVKGYGGFSPRIKLTGDQRFVASSGELEPIKTAIDGGAWINITNDNTGLVMIARPSNPAKWILRRGRSMQNAVFPGREPVALSRTQPTVLQYRLVIHDGTIEPATIDELVAAP